MPEEVVVLVDVSHCNTLQEKQERIKAFKHDVITIAELIYKIHERHNDKKRLPPAQLNKLCDETIKNLEIIINETEFFTIKRKGKSIGAYHDAIELLKCSRDRPEGKQPLYLYSLHINFIGLAGAFGFEIKQSEPIFELVRFIQHWSRTDFDIPSFIRKAIEMKENPSTVYTSMTYQISIY